MSYAIITNGNIGDAPLSPYSKSWWEELPGLRSEKLNESMGLTPLFQGQGNHTLNDLKDEDGPDLYATHSASTIMQVTIRNNDHPSLPGHLVRKLISPHQVMLLNYGRTDTWYFATDTFEATDLNNTTITHSPYSLNLP